MDVQELAEQYHHRTDEELLRLKVDEDQLTAETRVALHSELSIRGLGSEQVQQFRVEEIRQRELEKQQEERKALQKINYRYVHYGKADRDYDPETNLERFATTYFMGFAGLPLIPIGTYRMQRKHSWWRPITVVEKLPLDWNQVLTAWVVSAGILLVLLWAFKLLRYYVH